MIKLKSARTPTNGDKIRAASDEEMAEFNNPLVIAVDFDGTLCENAFPDIGKPKQHVMDYVKKLKSEGNKLILWTCREGELLEKAISWCHENGLSFDAYNANLPERIEEFGTDPRKIGADFYIDDRNILIKELL